jgi:hypothetical protein
MTPQEIFNTAYIGVLRQGDCAVNHRGECVYRAGDLKCAFGQLIPDSLYSLDMEGHRVGWVLKEYSAIAALVGPYPDLLNALQVAHDNAANKSTYAPYRMESFVTAAAGVARRYNLEIPNA